MTELIHFAFELGYGPISYLISRFGFSVGGWSHVRPLLDDGSSIDSFEDTITGKWPGFPSTIDPGVRLRPPHFRKLRASAVVAVPVTSAQKEVWKKFLWVGARAHLRYDHGAIDGFIEGRNLHTRKSYICSAWAAKSGRRIGLGHPSNVPVHEISPDILFALSQEAWGGKVIRTNR